MVFYNGHYFLPATSPLLLELLEHLNATNLQLLVVGFYNPSRATTPAFPNSILLTKRVAATHSTSYNNILLRRDRFPIPLHQ